MNLGTRHVLASCLLLAGCVDGFVEDDVDLGTEAAELRDQTWDPQSEQLLGAADKGYDRAFADDPGAVSLVRLDADGFVSPPAPGTWLTLPGKAYFRGPSIEFRVASTSRTDPAGRPLYHVQVGPSGGPYRDYCRTVDGTVQYAYALQAIYDQNAFFVPTLGRPGISFACALGAVAKAIRWNFAPGALSPATDVTASNQGWLAAATSMARADYCGNGVKHTLDGTPIQFDDVDGFSSAYVSTSGALPGQASEYVLEAAWGTELVNITGEVAPVLGYRGKAICISKWRYQALRVNECGVRVPDPRWTEFAYYCEDFGPAGSAQQRERLAAEGALTFSYSRVNDRGLWQWKVADANRWLTTDSGYFDGARGTVYPTEAPGTSYDGVPSYRGAILTAPKLNTVPLVQYRSLYAPSVFRVSADPAVGRARSCAGMFCVYLWVQPRTLGHVFVAGSAPSGGVALTEYTDGNQYRLFRAGEAIPAGWSPTRLDGEGRAVIEGYAIR